MKKPPHTIAHLRTVLSYDPDTGAFMWLVDVSKRAKAGYTAGTVNAAGYVQIQYDKHVYYAHVLAWAFAYDEWPSSLLDHKSQDKADNRISELRLADKSKNGLNRTAANKNSRTGVLGVSAHQGKFMARIGVEGRQRYLGIFETVEAAAAAYNEAKQRLLN